MQKIVFTFSFFVSLFCFSQEPSYHHYNTKNGLPSSEIYDVIQDKYGYLWFSSNYGLSRFDGYDFQHFTTEDGITNNTVFNFFKDPKGDIWCSTNDNSLFIISGEVPSFRPYKWNNKLIHKNRRAIKEVTITNKNEVFITFIGAAGYLSITDKGVVHESSVTYDSESNLWYSIVFNNNSCFNFFSQHKPSQNFTDLKLLSFKSKGQQWRNVSIHLPETNTSVLNLLNTLVFIKDNNHFKEELEHEILNLGQVSDSTFWVATRGGGVLLYNVNGERLETVLPGKSASSVTFDDQNGIWVTTLNNGVFHFKNRNIKSRKFNLETSNTVSIVSTKQSLWVGYVNGDLVKYEKGKPKKLKYFDLNRPTYLYYNEEHDDIFKFSCGSIIKNESQVSEKTSHLATMLSYKKGNKDYTLIFNQFYITLLENEKKVKTIENNITGKINSVLSYKDEVFIGGVNGLFKLKNDKLTNVTGFSPFNKIRVNTIQKHKGGMLIGTGGKGVIFYSGTTPTFLLSTKDGLTSDFIQKIYVQNDKTIWVATNSGLNKISVNSKNQYQILQITTKDGLINNEINDLTLHKDTIWIATKTGLSYFHNSTNFKPKKAINNFLKISNIKINDRNHQLTEELCFKYNENRIEINFSGISFNENYPPEYRFKLKDLESKWNYSTSRKAVYPGLQPDNYTFIVQFKGENGMWHTQSKTLSFTIRPPFWKTNWFIALTIGLFILFNYLFFKFRILRFNGALLRELLRLSLKKLKRGNASIVVKDGTEKVKILSNSIKYVKAYGNYIEIYHDKGKTMTRQKISDFLETIPDQLEYVQVRRSYIVRIDRVEQKGKKSLVVGGEKINVGSTYLAELEKIQL